MAMQPAAVLLTWPLWQSTGDSQDRQTARERVRCVRVCAAVSCLRVSVCANIEYLWRQNNGHVRIMCVFHQRSKPKSNHQTHKPYYNIQNVMSVWTILYGVYFTQS